MNSVYGKGPVSFNDITCRGTPTGFGPNPQPQLTYYVKQEGGSNANNGRSWKAALKTYQAGVTLATRASNRYKDVDLIIAPGEYDEQVIVSGVAQGIYQGASDFYAYRVGWLRIIHMGKAVILKNSSDDLTPTSHTLLIRRQKVELYGGIFRNYTTPGDFSAVCWERDTGLGDVIYGKMVGCKVEGRNGAIGIDIDAAQYVWVERCVISAFDTGILIAGNGLGAPVENVIRDCYFRGNTNDIMLGADQFTLIENCKFVDDAITEYIKASDYAGRTAATEDCVVVGCQFNLAGNISGQLQTGVKYIDNHTRDI